MKPLDIVEQHMFGPLDDYTRESIQLMLRVLFPEATWVVTVTSSGVSITPIFNRPEDQTFYLLKWF